MSISSISDKAALDASKPPLDRAAAAPLAGFSLPFPRGEAQVFVIVLLLAIVSRALLIFAHHYAAIDDFLAVLGEWSDDDFFDHMISQGRPLEYVLWRLLHYAGVNFATLSSTVGVLHNVVLTASALVLCRIFSLSCGTGFTLIFALIFVLHPFQTEQQTIQAFLWSADTSTALAFFGLLLSTRGWGGFLFGLVAISSSLLTFQTSFQYIATILCFAVVLNYAQNLTSPTRLSWWAVACDRRILIMSACFLCSVVVAAIADIVTMHVAGAGLRSLLLPWSEAPKRLGEFGKDLLEDNVLFSNMLKSWFAALAAISIVILAIRGAVWASIDRLVQLLIVAAGVVGGVIAVYSLVLVTADWWPVPRTLVGFSVWCAGVAALAYVAFPRKLHPPLAVLGALAALIFMGINAEVGVDQTRLNLRDQLLANRIVDRVERYDDFSPDIPTVVVGYTSTTMGEHIRIVQGDLNNSAFSVPWARLEILREISGYSLPDATSDQQEQASAYCQGHAKWPASDSVMIVQHVAIVCLPEQ